MTGNHMPLPSRPDGTLPYSVPANCFAMF